LRVKVETSKKTKKRLPYNYQYALASNLYKIMSVEDPELAENLHSNRTGKYFTFSWIDYEKGTAEGGLDFDEGWFYFSSPDYNLVQIVARGLLENPRIVVAGVPMEVTGIEAYKVPEMGGSATFRTLSPIYLKRVFETEVSLKILDLYPGDPQWVKELGRNLTAKYESYTGEKLKDPNLRVTQICRVKRKRINVAGSHRRCAMLEFTAEAHPDLLRFGYEAGFGEKNSMGFGCVEIKNFER